MLVFALYYFWLLFQVIARGGQHSSKKLASLVVAQKYSYDWRYSKLTMKMQNTPLASQEPWMLCADAEAMYPKSQLTSESKNRKVVAKAELKWGQTCSSDKFVVIKVSPAQLVFLFSSVSPLS